MAAQVLGDTIINKTSIITIESIQKMVAHHFSLQLNSLIGNSRRKEVAHARHIAIFLCKQLTDSSLKTIGLQFGGRDHSTVIHSLNIIQEKMLKDSSLSLIVKQMIEQAKSS